MTPPCAAETDIIEEAVRFRSGPYALEGRLCYPDPDAVRGAGVLAGPHPLLGGAMDNNVVRGLCTGLACRGVAILGFNYRGVGGSEGPRPDVTADLAEFWANSRTAEEAHYATDFRAAAAELPPLVGAHLPKAMIGYSFGCSILTAAAIDPVCPLVLVAPTIGQHDYATFAQRTNPMLVIAPDGDFAADVNVVTRWFATLRGPKRLVRGEWDTHFFRGQEGRLAETVFEFLRERWGLGT